MVISRIFGFLRDLAFAFFMGVGVVADIFFIGTRIPALIRSLLGENIINSSMLPRFQALRSQKGEAAAFSFSGQVLTTLFVLGLGLVLVVEIFTRPILGVIIPGLVGSGEFDDIVLVCRLAMPFSLFTILVCWQGAVLSAFGRFSAFAFTWAGFNLFFLAAAVWLYFAGIGQIGAVYTFAAVFTPGMALLSLFLFAVMRATRLPTVAVKPLKGSEEMRNFRRKFYVILGGNLFFTLNGLINLFLASFLPAGAISSIYYAERLVYLPLGILGVAVATVLLPSLSSHISKNAESKAIDSQNHAIAYALLLSLPAAIGIVLLADEIMQTLFVRGSFSLEDAAKSAAALKILGLIIPFMVMIKIFATGFYSRGDAKTPFKINALSTLVNLVIAASMMFQLGYLALVTGMATAVFVSASLMGIILYRRGQILPSERLIRQVLRIIAATVAMAAVVLLLRQQLPIEPTTEFLSAAGRLTIIVAVAVGFYVTLAWAMGVFSLADIGGSARKRRRQ